MNLYINNTDVVCAGCQKETGSSIHLCTLNVGTENEVCINLCPECISELDRVSTEHFI